MKSIVRILVIFFILVALVAALLAAGFRIFFTEERLKQLALDGLRGSLQRDVSLGRVSAGIFSGVKIENFSLSEYPGFPQGTFASVKEITAGGEIMPLFHRRLIVGEVTLSEPSVRIARDKHGGYNVSDPFLYERKEGGGRSYGWVAAPMYWYVSSLVVRNGRATLENIVRGGAPVEITNVNLKARDITSDDTFDMKFSFAARQGK